MTWCAKTAEEIDSVGGYAAGGTGHCKGCVMEARRGEYATVCERPWLSC